MRTRERDKLENELRSQRALLKELCKKIDIEEMQTMYNKSADLLKQAEDLNEDTIMLSEKANKIIKKGYRINLTLFIISVLALVSFMLRI